MGAGSYEFPTNPVRFLVHGPAARIDGCDLRLLAAFSAMPTLLDTPRQDKHLLVM
jgi:hypothetical protein